MARLLKEGLAQVLTTKTADAWATRAKSSVALDMRFNATDGDWNAPLRSSLYQSSEAFIQKLMNTQQGRKSIARLLLAEQVNGCDNLNNSDVSSILGNLSSL